MDKATTSVIKACKGINMIAAVVLFANCALVVANIITRSALFKFPIFGVYEMVCYLSLVSVSFALANCAIEGGHTNLTFLVDKLSERKRKIVEIAVNLIIVVNFIFITYNLFGYMKSRYLVGDVSAVMRIPLQYVVAFIVVGFVLLTLTPIIKIIEDVKILKNISCSSFFQEGS